MKPKQTFRAGQLEVALWEKDGKLSATIRKTYKDEQTGEWKEAKSLQPNDLPVVASLLLQAHQACVTKQ